MKHEKRLTQNEQDQVEVQQEQVQSASVHEFATPEDLLRHDALHTPVPPTIVHRLEESINKPSPGAASWWRRLLGGSEQ